MNRARSAALVSVAMAGAVSTKIPGMAGLRQRGRCVLERTQGTPAFGLATDLGAHSQRISYLFADVKNRKDRCRSDETIAAADF